METPSLIEREIKIPFELKIKRAISIIGPRRSGKTYLMFQLIKNLRAKVERNRVLYINFEDYRLEGSTFRDVLDLVNTFYEMFPQNKRKKFGFSLMKSKM